MRQHLPDVENNTLSIRRVYSSKDMADVCMIIYATKQPAKTCIYDGSALCVGNDLPSEAINDFNNLFLCKNAKKGTHDISGASVAFISKEWLCGDDISNNTLLLNDMMSMTPDIIELNVNFISCQPAVNHVTSRIMEYLNVCSKHKLHVCKILVPKCPQTT
jgi:hypothetical protein